MDIRKCFEILELDTDASIDDLNQAYKDLVVVWHPDRFSANPRLKRKAEEKLKVVNQAYEKVLFFLSTEPESRKTAHNHGIQKSLRRNFNTNSTPKRTNKKNIPSHPGKDTTVTSQGVPIPRFFARSLDYLLFCCFLRMVGAGNILPETEFPMLLFPALLAFAWIIPEASLLSIFGATPGKWIFRMKVMDIFHLKPKFSGTLRRSLSVWCNGMGMGVFFIAPITAIAAYFRIKKTGCTIWDRDGKFSIPHHKIGTPRIVAAVLLFFATSIFLILEPNIMIEAYKQAARIKPNDPKTHFNLGESYFAAERYNEAIKAYKRAIEIKSDYAQAHCNLGSCYVELQRYDDAVPYFKRAIGIEPGYAEALFGLGFCCARLGHFLDAVTALKQSAAGRPDYAQVYYELGMCYMALERYDEAVEANKRAMKLEPDHAQAHGNLGTGYLRLGRTEEAIESFKTALQIDPEYTMGYYHLGLCYVDLGRYKDALEPFKKVIELDSDHAEAFYGIGLCYAKLRHTTEAIKILSKAVEIKPDYAQAHHILGLSYLTLGKNNKALEQYEILKSLDRDLAEELLDYIQNIPGSELIPRSVTKSDIPP